MSKTRASIPLRPETPEWMKEWNPCTTSDADLFHPAKDDKQATIDAKKLCFGCPNRQVCLEYALSHNEVWGTWGGMTAAERGRLRRGPGRAAA